MNTRPIWSDPVGLVFLVVFVAVVTAFVWGVARLSLFLPRARPVFAAVVVALGALAAYLVLRVQWAYEAAFVWQQFMFVMVSALAGCAVLAPFPRTRAAARVGAVGALLMVASFLAVYLTGYLSGLYVWGGNVAVPVR